MPELNTRADLLNVVQDLRENLEQSIVAAGPGRMEQPDSFGPWTFKDLIAHLTGWRLVTAARLEAGLNNSDVTFPWPAHMEEGAETPHEINEWFYETNRAKSIDVVLSESRDTFERVETSLRQLSDDDLFLPGRFPFLNWTEEGLGPAVVRGSWNHYYVEHEPEIRAWLERS